MGRQAPAVWCLLYVGGCRLVALMLRLTSANVQRLNNSSSMSVEVDVGPADGHSRSSTPESKTDLADRGKKNLGRNRC